MEAIAAKGSLERLGETHFKEYRCLADYVFAKEQFNEWFEFCHKRCPQKPEIPKKKKERDYMEEVSAEAKQARYLEELSRWKGALQGQSVAVAACLEEVLKYPGGWLECGEEEEDSDPSKELDYLRRVCLVDAAFLLHAVYDKAGEHGKAAKVADLVAADEHAVYSAFSREDMRRFLDRVRESFVQMLDEGRDPWK